MTEVRVTAVETNGDRPPHREERYTKASEKASTPSTQREESVADSKKEMTHESDPTRDGVAKINSDVEKTTVAETNGEKTDHEEEHNTEGGERGITQSQIKPQTRHWITKSVQETVTMSESNTTEAQVCSV